MLKRCFPLMFCLLSTIYSSLLAATEHYWSLIIAETGAEYGGTITQNRQEHRTVSQATPGCACCFLVPGSLECFTGCERSGSAVYSEAFTRSIQVNPGQSLADVPPLFRRLLDINSEGVFNTYSLNYTMESPSRTLRNTLAWLGCLFCPPWYCFAVECLEDMFWESLGSTNSELYTATPYDSPNRVSITNRQVAYRFLQPDQSHTEVTSRVLPLISPIMSLFLTNTEAQRWVEHHLADSAPVVNLTRDIWIPELWNHPISANIQIQGHSVRVCTERPHPVVTSLIPSHFMRLTIPSSNSIDTNVVYHIRRLENGSFRVLAVVLAQGTNSLRFEMPGYISQDYRVPPPYGFQSLVVEQLPDSIEMQGSHFQHPHLPESGSP